MTHVNIGGVWKQFDKVWVNIGGVWKQVDKIFCNIGGVWKQGWVAYAPNVYGGTDGDNSTARCKVNKINSDGGQVWSYVGIDYWFQCQAIAVDPDGYVVATFVDPVNDTYYVRKINPSGSLVWSKTVPGVSLSMSGIAIDSLGRVYYYQNDIVIRVSSDGSTQELACDLNDSLGSNKIGIDNEGNIYAGSASGDKLYRIGNDGIKDWENTDPNNDVLAVATTSSTWVFFGDRDGKIFKVDRVSGNTSWQYASGSQVNGLAIDQNNYLYGAHANGSLRKYDVSGGSPPPLIWTYSAGSDIKDVSVDPQGNSYIAVSTYIRKISPSGNLIWQYNLGAIAIRVAADPGQYGAFPDTWAQLT